MDLKYSALIPLIVGLMWTGLVFGSDQNRLPESQIWPARTPAQALVASNDEGTVDGGGGAGRKGANHPLEEDIRHVETFSEFNRYVRPILDAITKIHPQYGKIFWHVVKDRNWIFTHESIPKLSQRRQGSPVSLDQWAEQNSKEIWFSNKFDHADGRGRAYIMLHEILVGIKILRFTSQAEYCSMTASSPEYCLGDDGQALNSNYRLTPLDYGDVRTMTDWLFQNFRTMTPMQFGVAMTNNQFQSYYFSWQRYQVENDLGQDQGLTPWIRAALGQPVRLFTNYGSDHIAKDSCTIKLSMVDKGHVSVNLQIADLKTGSVIATHSENLLIDLADSDQLFRPSLRYGRTIYTYATETKLLKKVGETGRYANLEFDQDGNLFGYEEGTDMIDRQDQNGTPYYFSKSWDNPDSYACYGSVVELPWNYGDWESMRRPHRELLEKIFLGKTMRELLQEIRTRYPNIPADY